MFYYNETDGNGSNGNNPSDNDAPQDDNNEVVDDLEQPIEEGVEGQEDQNAQQPDNDAQGDKGKQSGNQGMTRGQRLGNKLGGFADRFNGNKEQLEQKKAEYEQKEPSYKKHNINRKNIWATVRAGKHSTNPIAQQQAKDLADREKDFGKGQKHIQKALKSNKRPKKILQVVDALENEQAQKAEEVRKKDLVLKRQLIADKFPSPIKEIVGCFFTCWNFITGVACVTLIVGTYTVLNLTGVI